MRGAAFLVAATLLVACQSGSEETTTTTTPAVGDDSAPVLSTSTTTSPDDSAAPAETNPTFEYTWVFRGEDHQDPARAGTDIRVCEELVDQGMSVCADETAPDPPESTCYGFGNAEVEVVDNPSDPDDLMISVAANATNIDVDQHRSNHVIVGFTPLPLQERGIGMITASAKVHLPAGSDENLEVGPELSVQHTRSTEVTQIIALQHQASRFLTPGWNLWVEAEGLGGRWAHDLINAPPLPPGSEATIEVTADFEMGQYRSVVITIDDDPPHQTLLDIAIPTEHRGFEPATVFTIEAENLYDCDNNLPEATTGRVLYDDLRLDVTVLAAEATSS